MQDKISPSVNGTRQCAWEYAMVCHRQRSSSFNLYLCMLKVTLYNGSTKRGNVVENTISHFQWASQHLLDCRTTCSQCRWVALNFVQVDWLYSIQQQWEYCRVIAKSGLSIPTKWLIRIGSLGMWLANAYQATIGEVFLMPWINFGTSQVMKVVVN